MAWELLAEHVTLRYAVAVGVIVATLCSVLSVLVVLKRLAFIGQGISHAGFGGIGTAMVLGLGPGLGQDALVLIFCLAAAMGIGYLARRQRLEPDSAIGVLLVAAMAWGVLMANLAGLLQQQRWYVELVGPPMNQPGFETLLFGSLLQVGPTDLIAAAVVAAIVGILMAGLFKEIVFFTFDESAARVFGVPTGLIHYLLLAVLSLVIVVSIRLVGFLLVSALLVIPGAAATLLSRRLAHVLGLALTVGLAGTLGGLWLSLSVGYLAAGPCIVAVLCLLLGAAGGLRQLRGQ